MLRARIVTAILPIMILPLLVSGCGAWRLFSAPHHNVAVVGFKSDRDGTPQKNHAQSGKRKTPARTRLTSGSLLPSPQVQRGTQRPAMASPAHQANGDSHNVSTMPDATSPFQTLGQSTASRQPGGSTSSTRGGVQTALQKSHLKPSETQIIKPYVTTLTRLQTKYIQSLNRLYDEAKAEYHAGKQSKTAVENKYLPEVISLQNSAQDQLNRLLFNLKDKLQGAGYSTTPVDTLRSAYYTEVAQLQAKLGR